MTQAASLYPFGANMGSAKKSALSLFAFLSLFALLTALSTPAHAEMTGKELLNWCRSKNLVEETGCKLYISGFVHGLQMARDLTGLICVPNSLNGDDASRVFVQTLESFEETAASGRGPPLEANPLFNGPVNAALGAALGMKFKCLQKSDSK
jgi:hypothetical protein